MSPIMRQSRLYQVGIMITDAEPVAMASIWEQFVDQGTEEFFFSLSLLTINADCHEVMKHFNKLLKKIVSQFTIRIKSASYKTNINVTHLS